MGSLSFELLQMADTIHASSSSSSSSSDINHDERRDDAIPPKVQQHLAGFLAGPTVSANTLHKLFNESEYVNQKDKILRRTMIPPVPSGEWKDGLQALPMELLDLIVERMDPADAVCLGLTCRRLSAKVNYQAQDLKNLGFAPDLFDCFHEHELQFALARQRFAVVNRTRRDRVGQLMKDESEDREMLVCGVCVALHPNEYFGAKEKDEDGQGRRCLAATAELKICKHWSEDLSALRRRKEESVCYPNPDGPGRPFRSVACRHRDHETEEAGGGFGAPTMIDVGLFWILERVLRLGEFESREVITEGVVREVLSGKEDLRICEHIMLSDEATKKSVEKEGLGPARWGGWPMEKSGEAQPDLFEGNQCGVCETCWEFRICRVRGCREPPVFVLKLVVERSVKAVKDPWTVEYLRGVEGSEDLLKLTSRLRKTSMALV